MGDSGRNSRAIIVEEFVIDFEIPETFLVSMMGNLKPVCERSNIFTY